MTNLKNLTNQELLERFAGLKVALVEQGHTENVVSAYITCTTEICMRYFNEHGLVDQEAREELLQEEFQKVAAGEAELLDVAKKYGMTYEKQGKTYAKATLFHLFNEWQDTHL